MDRRAFFRRTSLALPALLVGDAALEAFERLTHRKVFALGGLAPRVWFDVRKLPDRPIYYLGAVVDNGFGRHQVYRAAATEVTGFGTPSLNIRNQLRYQLAKMGQQISREHGISLNSMIPAMEEAFA